MSSRPFKDNSYDRLLWDEIWKKAEEEALKNDWSKTRCVNELAGKIGVSSPAIWRYVISGEIKWKDGTRKNMYSYAGYDSIEAFANKRSNPDDKSDNPQQETTAAQNEPNYTRKGCRYDVPARPTYFIGRQEMLKDVHHMLTENSGRHNILLLNGIGGMGKTTLMQEYLNTDNYVAHFNNLIVISVNRNLENAFITGVDRALTINAKEIILHEDKINAVTNVLKASEGNNLFVIDNINEYDYKDLLRMIPVFNVTRWKFLITTRTAPDADDIEILPVDELNIDDAVLLFAYHFVPDNIDRRNEASLNRYITDNKLRKDIELLLEYFSRHTLLTELLAKTGKKKGISVFQLLEILQTQDLKDARLERTITIGRHSELASKELRQTTLYNYIFNLFDTDYLVKSTGDKAQDIENKEKVTLLKYFSVLPSEDIPLEDMKTLCAITPEMENVFEDRLDELKQIGWLQGKQQTGSGHFQNIAFSMHPLVQQVVYDKLRPTISCCKPLLETINGILPRIKSYPQKYQNYAKSVIDKLNYLKNYGAK